MSAISIATPTRQQLYEQLMSYADGSVHSAWLAQIIASWQLGAGALPDALGLNHLMFAKLVAQHFPGSQLDTVARSCKTADFSRMLEKQQLEQLLRQYALLQNDDTECLITIIVTACLGNDHLWQDLGLWSRDDLSAMLKQHFPEMVALNCYDMKWKKFIYKLLCDAEGIYVCRAPSCEVCTDYLGCYGEED
ncbi:MAG: nitrogen fixation protein NifQ [Methylococcales bacterium]